MFCVNFIIVFHLPSSHRTLDHCWVWTFTPW